VERIPASPGDDTIVFEYAVGWGSTRLTIGFLIGGGGRVLLEGFQKGLDVNLTSQMFNAVMLGYVATCAGMGVLVGLVRAANAAASGMLG
jgi:hypothetical protein